MTFTPPAFVLRTPPIAQEPSEPIDSGRSRPASSAAACASASVTPASTVRVKSSADTARTRRIRFVVISTSPFGTCPPTRPVFPPCGTIAMPCSWQ